MKKLVKSPSIVLRSLRSPKADESGCDITYVVKKVLNVVTYKCRTLNTQCSTNLP